MIRLKSVQKRLILSPDFWDIAASSEAGPGPDCQPSIAWDLTTLDSCPACCLTGFIISQAGARLCRTLRALRDPPSAVLRVDHFRYHDTCAAVITPVTMFSWPLNVAPWCLAWPWWPAPSPSAWHRLHTLTCSHPSLAHSIDVQDSGETWSLKHKTEAA